MKDYKEIQDLHNLDMHETMKIRTGFHVTRVPGGWLYETSVKKNNIFKKENSDHISTTFVPYIDNRVSPTDEHDF